MEVHIASLIGSSAFRDFCENICHKEAGKGALDSFRISMLPYLLSILAILPPSRCREMRDSSVLDLKIQPGETDFQTICTPYGSKRGAI